MYCLNTFRGEGVNDVPLCSECRVPEEGTSGPDSIVHLRARAIAGLIAHSQPVSEELRHQPASQRQSVPLQSLTRHSVSQSHLSYNVQLSNAQDQRIQTVRPEGQIHQLQQQRQPTQPNVAGTQQNPGGFAELQAQYTQRIKAASEESREKKRQRTEEPAPNRSLTGGIAPDTSNLQPGRVVSTEPLLAGIGLQPSTSAGQSAANASELTVVPNCQPSQSNIDNGSSRSIPRDTDLVAGTADLSQRSTLHILPDSDVPQADSRRQSELVRTAQQQFGDPQFALDDAVLLRRKNSVFVEFDAFRITERQAVVQILQDDLGQEVVGERSGWYYGLRKENKKKNWKWRRDGQPELVLWRQERLLAANTENDGQAEGEEEGEEEADQGQGSVSGDSCEKGTHQSEHDAQTENLEGADEEMLD